MGAALRHLRDLVARHRALSAVLAVTALLLVAIPVGIATTRSLSPGRTDASTADLGVGATSPEVQEGAEAAMTAGARDAAADSGPLVAADLPAQARVVRSAWLAVEVDDLSSAAARVRAVAAGAGGEVVGESLSLGDPAPGPVEDGGRDAPDLGAEGAPQPVVPRGTATLTLRVPTDRLAVTVDRLAEVGTLVRRTSSAEDVTQAYVDTEARVDTMRAAVARLRALLAQADGLEQVVLLEGELTRRTAELESLEQRLADLERRTSTADVTITLTAATGAEDEDPAYWSALWGHLRDSAGVILVGLAVLLPWVALVALAALVVALVRRRGTARRPPRAAGDGT